MRRDSCIFVKLEIAMKNRGSKPRPAIDTSFCCASFDQFSSFEERATRFNNWPVKSPNSYNDYKTT